MANPPEPEVDVPAAQTAAPPSRDHLPPLLRGIGTTLVMLGTVIALISARRGMETQRLKKEAARQPSTATATTNRDLNTLANEVDEMKADAGDESLAEEVFENRWFEWMGILGSAVLASSFYTEAALRKSKRM